MNTAILSIEDGAAIRERPGTAAVHPDAVAMISSDIPEGMTIAEYRRRRCAATPKVRGLRRAIDVIARAI